MRRFLAVILLMFVLATAVSAASGVTDLQSNTTVKTDGTCQVSLTVQLRMEEAVSNLVFPVPGNARDISLNGSSVRAPVSGNRRLVDLSGAVPGAGVYTFMIHYSLPDSITMDQTQQLYLKFDLLSGFAYPIENMTFTVTLPDQPQKKPTFSSTYYPETVDMFMELTTEGNTITGTFTQPLMDQETLSFSLAVTKAMFPQSMVKIWKMDTDDVIMIIVALLAAAYWVLTMRNTPPRRILRSKEPEGLTAGELGCCLTGQGVDFTMMVISWAQMGYLLIQLDDNDRVLLHKRMEMGNERSDFEVRHFDALFGRRQTVDGTGYHYARLCRKASALRPNIRGYYLRASGNPYIFRGLCAVIGLLGGISLATAFVYDTAWRVILSILLGALGVIASWQIQSGAMCLHTRRKLDLLLSLGCCGIWLLLGLLAGELNVALLVIAAQWIGGIATAYGGRRSDLGKHNAAQILGLRRYLKRVPHGELQRILSINPDYYYSLAPYAMALGVDKSFARRFGDLQLTECTYLTTGMDGHMTAKEWNRLLRDTVSLLDDRQLKLPFEQLFRKV